MHTRVLIAAALAAGSLAAQPNPSLPPRFPLPLPEPFIRKPVEPMKFAAAVGRRAALLGRENGVFEAWINPVKVLRDFHLSLYLDGSLDAMPLADLADSITVGAGRTTITYSHALFTIRETWFAPLDKPALVVLLDIDTSRPLRLRASFVPEMQPMWPASFGGQVRTWSAPDHVFMLSEATRRHAAAIGSPLATRASTGMGVFEMDVTPEIGRRNLVPIVIAASAEGTEGTLRLYLDTLAKLQDLVSESDSYYRDFQAKTLRVQTPEPALNRAFEWAKLALEKGWSCSERMGCGLVAGFGPSGAGDRPASDWFFGRDALINSWAIVDYGDLVRARAVLEFLRDHQREDGRLLDELTQSAALIDRAAYPPPAGLHDETTPLYLFSAARYVVRSGDLEYLKASWPSIDKAYKYCLAAVDADGLMRPTHPLSGRVSKDIYLEGAWLAGLDGYAILAGLAKHAEEATDARKRLEQARKSVDGWYRADKGYYPYGKLADGAVFDGQSAWPALALAYGGVDAQKAEKASAALKRAELSTPWGLRLFATDSSAPDRSVWPYLTGFAALAEYRNHLAAEGLAHLYSVASLTGFSGAGFIPEVLSGERAQTPPEAAPYQLISSASVIHPLVRGMLGLGGDAEDGTFSFVPHLPSYWPSLRFELYRIGQSWVSGEVSRQTGQLEIKLTVVGKPLKIYLAPALLPNTTVKSLRINGKKAQVHLEPSGADTHAIVEMPQTMALDAVFQLREGLEARADLPSFEVGQAPEGRVPAPPQH